MRRLKSYCLSTGQPLRCYSLGPQNTRPLRFVPRKYPYPASISCSTAPLNEFVVLVPGTFTLPENVPFETVRLALNEFGLLLMTLFLSVRVTRFVNGALRLPPSNTIMPLVKSITLRTGLAGAMYREQVAAMRFVKPFG